MVQVAKNWRFDVDRGPGCLFVKLHRPEGSVSKGAKTASNIDENSPELANDLWEVLQQHFSNRMVLELDQLPLMRSSLIGQLLLLNKKMEGAGGMLRLTGVSAENQEVLHRCRLDERLSVYPDRTHAIRGN